MQIGQRRDKMKRVGEERPTSQGNLSIALLGKPMAPGKSEVKDPTVQNPARGHPNSFQ
jgi:hypothetical protein